MKQMERQERDRLLDKVSSKANQVPDCMFACARWRGTDIEIDWMFDDSYTTRELVRIGVEKPIQNAAGDITVRFNYFTVSPMDN